MKTRLLGIVVGIAVLTLVTVSGSALGRGEAAKPVRLKAATLIVEVNATDGDAGLQVFLDGEPWRSMRITAPNGREIASVEAQVRMAGFSRRERKPDQLCIPVTGRSPMAFRRRRTSSS